MSYDALYNIAAQGMNIEKLRIDLVANNIAHQYTLQKAGGEQYRPMQVLATAKHFSDHLVDINDSNIDVAIVPQNIPANKVYQPENPLADKQGYLTYPGISMVNEMTTLLSASRAFEANIKVINTTHGLYLQALTIGDER